MKKILALMIALALCVCTAARAWALPRPGFLEQMPGSDWRGLQRVPASVVIMNAPPTPARVWVLRLHYEPLGCTDISGSLDACISAV